MRATQWRLASEDSSATDPRRNTGHIGVQFIDMAGIEVVLAPLQGLLGFFQKERHERLHNAQLAETQRQEALQAMYAALVATKRCQELNSQAPDRARELELSQLWATAAIKSRTYVKEATGWNANKAEYWLSQMKWPDEAVRAKGIDLATVEARILQLMAQQQTSGLNKGQAFWEPVTDSGRGTRQLDRIRPVWITSWLATIRPEWAGTLAQPPHLAKFPKGTSLAKLAFADLSSDRHNTV